ACNIMKCSVIVTLCFCSLLSLTAANLIDDLREFKALIPINTIKTLGIGQYVFDIKFRTAINYIRSRDFMRTLADISEKLSDSEIGNYLKAQSSGHDLLGAFYRIIKNMRQFRMPSKLLDNIQAPRSLESFLVRVKAILPRARFYNFAVQKVRSSPEFATFYKGIKAPEFKRLVLATRVSQSL
ncbi:hypothetical protein KR215_001652, partial [Drosophila sulfurigaster]